MGIRAAKCFNRPAQNGRSSSCEEMLDRGGEAGAELGTVCRRFRSAIRLRRPHTSDETMNTRRFLRLWDESEIVIDCDNNVVEKREGWFQIEEEEEEDMRIRIKVSERWTMPAGTVVESQPSPARLAAGREEGGGREREGEGACQHQKIKEAGVRCVV